jgi:hypothetical protein
LPAGAGPEFAMSAEQKNTEQNALARGLTSTWTRFKEGKLISYKLMAVILLLVAGLGLWWYIASERRKSASQQWMALDEARSVDLLEKVAKTEGNPTASHVADLAIARALLGPQGIAVLNAPTPTGTSNDQAVANIEKARETFTKLLDQLNHDPVMKAECLLGLAKAEAALVGVSAKSEPAPPGGQLPLAPSKDFRGSIDKVIEYLDKLSEAAAPDTPWATDSKKMADALRSNRDEFTRIQQSLTGYHGLGGFGKDDPHGPLGPLPK